AVQAVRQLQPARVIVAVPVGAPDACDEFADITDETVCAHTPEPFRAVGLWYRDFSETADDEVRSLLRQHADRLGESIVIPVEGERYHSSGKAHPMTSVSSLVMAHQSRRLLQTGAALLLYSFFEGFFIPVLGSPRIGLSV